MKGRRNLLIGTAAIALCAAVGNPASSASFGPSPGRGLPQPTPAWLNVLNYGAIGNGSSNPASSRFASLGALQQFCGGSTTLNGVTLALTQELDWIGAELAVQAATANGCVVYFPGARVFVFSNSNSASDGSGTISQPAASVGSAGVSLEADWTETFLEWPHDTGSGKFAILCGGRASGSSVGQFQSLSLIGPGCGSTFGSSACNMQGIGTNDRRNIFDCFVAGFKVGINVVGGQCEHSRNVQQSNYYGYYWDTPNSGNFGDMKIDRALVQGSLMAAIAVHHAASIIATKITKSFFGTCPFSLYKETNSGAPTQAIITQYCDFDLCQFENIGNAWICDDTAAPASRVVSLFKTTFRSPQFCWDTFNSLNYHISGVSAYAMWDIKICQDCVIEGTVLAAQWQPGTVAMFSIQQGSGLRIFGDISQLLSNCTNIASAPNYTNQVNNFAAGDWDFYSSVLVQEGAGWSGRVAFASAAVAAGEIVVDSGNAQPVAPSAGNSTEVPVGVVVYAPGTGSFCVVAEAGWVPVTTTGTITAGAFVRTAASGAGETTGSNAIVGVALSNAGTNLWNVSLRGLN